MCCNVKIVQHKAQMCKQVVDMVWVCLQLYVSENQIFHVRSHMPKQIFEHLPHNWLTQSPAGFDCGSERYLSVLWPMFVTWWWIMVSSLSSGQALPRDPRNVRGKRSSMLNEVRAGQALASSTIADSSPGVMTALARTMRTTKPLTVRRASLMLCAKRVRRTAGRLNESAVLHGGDRNNHSVSQYNLDTSYVWVCASLLKLHTDHLCSSDSWCGKHNKWSTHVLHSDKDATIMLDSTLQKKLDGKTLEANEAKYNRWFMEVITWRMTRLKSKTTNDKT